jgi:hypothetical protein
VHKSRIRFPPATRYTPIEHCIAERSGGAQAGGAFGFRRNRLGRALRDSDPRAMGSSTGLTRSTYVNQPELSVTNERNVPVETRQEMSSGLLRRWPANVRAQAADQRNG